MKRLCVFSKLFGASLVAVVLLSGSTVNATDSGAHTLANSVLEETCSHANLLGLSAGKDIVAVIGNTSAGKSTVINFLGGKKLLGDAKGDIVLSDKHDASAMAIGCSGESMTRYPRCMQIGNHLFFDLPGFRDTGNTSRHLVNAAFIAHIISSANSVKIVFVTGQDEITASRGSLLKDFLDVTESLFHKNPGIVTNSSMLIVTKSSQTDRKSAAEFILSKTISTHHPQLQNWISRDMLFHMKRPSVQGPIVEEGDKVDVLSALPKLIPQRIPSVNIT